MGKKKFCYWCDWETQEDKESVLVFSSDDGEIFRIHSLCLGLLVKEYVDNRKNETIIPIPE